MKKKPRILLLEDDPLQAEWMADEVILKIFPDAELRYYDSEHSFFAALKSREIQQWNPQFAIIDLLIHYYSVDDLGAMDASPEFKTLDFSKAGIRCREALRNECPDAKIAVITVLDDTPDGLVIRKGDDDSEHLMAFLRNEST